MTDTGAISPGTMATSNANGGTLDWTNPNNSKVSDNAYTTAASLLAQTYYLKATNFGFTIPTGATINGIIVEIERKSSHSNIIYKTTDDDVKIIKADGSIGTTDKASATRWTTAEAYFAYGANNDLWGESSWSAENINDADFGVAVSVVVGSGEMDTTVTASVDHIRITVYYTEGGTNYVQNATETITLNESPIKSSVKYTIETLTNAISATKDASKNISESLTFTDSVIASWLITQYLAEALTLTDSNYKNIILRPKQTFTISDSLYKTWTATRSLTENLTLSDSSRKNISTYPVETMTLLDSNNKTFTLRKSEGLSILDSIVTIRTIISYLTENLTISDSTDLIKGVIMLYLTEQLRLLDSKRDFPELRNRLYGLTRLLSDDFIT